MTLQGGDEDMPETTLVYNRTDPENPWVDTGLGRLNASKYVNRRVMPSAPQRGSNCGPSRSAWPLFVQQLPRSNDGSAAG